MKGKARSDQEGIEGGNATSSLQHLSRLLAVKGGRTRTKKRGGGWWFVIITTGGKPKK